MRLARQIREEPQVKDVIAVSGTSFVGGGNSSNVASLFVVLKPWNQRRGADNSVDAVIRRVDELSASVQEAVVFSVNPPAIPGLGASSGLEMQLLDINNLGSARISQVVEEMQRRAAEVPELAQITSMYRGEVPQFRIKVDREKAKMYSLTLEQIYQALGANMGSSYVNDFVKFGRTYEVLVSADAAARATPQSVLSLAVRNSRGDMVPFGAFASVVPDMGESTVNRYNMYTTAAITGTTAAHVSSSEGIRAMEEMVENVAGDSFGYAWTGEAYQETQGGTTIALVLVFAVIITILVLAAQYESWTNPLAVVATTPTAVSGAVLGCLFMNQSISIYTQIGIILLLGMAAKNAILIVEYAMDYRKRGVPVRQAATEAGNVRFRPVMMTALAFVFGVMPMLFATGAGAASRVSLGSAVVFGMAVNALVGTLFVPAFWELLQRFNEKYLSNVFGKQ